MHSYTRGGESDRLTTDRAELFEEVRLCSNHRERERYDNLADLYSLIVSLQSLEKAYIKDCILPKEYTSACSRLLTQFKAALKQAEQGAGGFRGIDDFIKKYRVNGDTSLSAAALASSSQLNCPLALERISEGRPITIKSDKGNTSKMIADIVSLFITLMDKLKLNMHANDMLQQEVRELLDIVNRLPILSADYIGKEKLHKWLCVLMAMDASDELSEEQVRNMQLDLELAYNQFNQILHDDAAN